MGGKGNKKDQQKPSSAPSRAPLSAPSGTVGTAVSTLSAAPASHGSSLDTISSPTVSSAPLTAPTAGTVASSSSAAPSHGSASSSAAPSHGSSLDTRVSPPHYLFITSSPPLTSPALPSGRPDEPEIFTFKVIYMEYSLELEVPAEAEGLASEAINKAVATATQTFAKAVGASDFEELDFMAYVSYPPTIRDKELTVKQWICLGHEPFIAIGLKDESKGFSALLLETKKDLSNLKIWNEELVANGLQTFGVESSSSPPRPCKGCKFLVAALATHQHELDTQKHELATQKHINAAINNKLQELKAENEVLQADREKMRTLRRRILVEKARNKAIRALGLKHNDVDTWQEFFRKHRKALMERHGISKELHHLLMYGKGFLIRVAHRGVDIDLADAVSSMIHSPQRVQFAHAFTYIFGCTPESFMGEDED